MGRGIGSDEEYEEEEEEEEKEEEEDEKLVVVVVAQISSPGAKQLSSDPSKGLTIPVALNRLRNEHGIQRNCSTFLEHTRIFI